MGGGQKRGGVDIRDAVLLKGGGGLKKKGGVLKLEGGVSKLEGVGG